MNSVVRYTNLFIGLNVNYSGESKVRYTYNVTVGAKANKLELPDLDHHFGY